MLLVQLQEYLLGWIAVIRGEREGGKKEIEREGAMVRARDKEKEERERGDIIKRF